MKYEVKKMRRYAKLIEVHPNGDRSAIAFYDYNRNIWLCSASWSRPSNTLFAGPEFMGGRRVLEMADTDQ